MKECLNCQTPLPEVAKFCPNCGQKNRDGRVSVTEFFSIFFDTYFNIDSNIFKTAFGLFVPGRLTTQFFEGRRKSYLHPLRIFLLMSAFYIAVIGFQINGFLSEKADNMSKEVHEYFVKDEVLNQIDSIQNIQIINQSNCVDTSLVDSLRSLYEVSILDSLGEDINLSVARGAKIRLQDFYNQSIPDLVEKYEITDWKEIMMLKQLRRFVNDPDKYIQTIIGNIIWLILLLMPLIALMLKLYYVRHGYYFVEHLVFSFHFNAFAFFLVGMATWISGSNGGAVLAANFTAAIFLFFAMKKFYQQSYPKTFLKWLLLLFTYFMSTVFLVAILLTVSFVMF